MKRTTHWFSHRFFYIPMIKGYGLSSVSIIFAGKSVITGKYHLNGCISLSRADIISAMLSVFDLIKMTFFSRSMAFIRSSTVSTFNLNRCEKLKSST